MPTRSPFASRGKPQRGLFVPQISERRLPAFTDAGLPWWADELSASSDRNGPLGRSTNVREVSSGSSCQLKFQKLEASHAGQELTTCDWLDPLECCSATECNDLATSPSWVTSVDLRTPAPRQPITQNRKVAGKEAEVDQIHVRRCSIEVPEPRWVDLSQSSPLYAQYDEWRCAAATSASGHFRKWRVRSLRRRRVLLQHVAMVGSGAPRRAQPAL